MKLHFDPNQSYQLGAIASVVGVFEDQPLNHGDFSFSLDDRLYYHSEGGVENALAISGEQVLKNLRGIMHSKNLSSWSLPSPSGRES